jgi:hypothetical protein
MVCLAGAAGGLCGCVTAHECAVSVQPRDYKADQDLDNCILLTVVTRGVEESGHWWIVQDEPAGPAVPQEVRVAKSHFGEPVRQEGYLVGLIGPYAKSARTGYEYWLFHEDFEPEDFLDLRLERAYEDKKPLTIAMEHVQPGNEYSDEKVLDGARRVVELADFLPRESPVTARLVRLLAAQTQAVRKHSPKKEERQKAEELLAALAKLQAALPVEAPASPKLEPVSLE